MISLSFIQGSIGRATRARNYLQLRQTNNTARTTQLYMSGFNKSSENPEQKDMKNCDNKPTCISDAHSEKCSLSLISKTSPLSKKGHKKMCTVCKIGSFARNTLCHNQLIIAIKIAIMGPSQGYKNSSQLLL